MERIRPVMSSGLIDVHARVIIPHCGGAVPVLADRINEFMRLFLPAQEQRAPDAVQQLRGLCYDMAGTACPRQVPTLLKLVDRDRVLFGSDYCWTPGTALRTESVSRRLPALLTPCRSQPPSGTEPRESGCRVRRSTRRVAVRAHTLDPVSSTKNHTGRCGGRHTGGTRPPVKATRRKDAHTNARARPSGLRHRPRRNGHVPELRSEPR
ncbi:amidohydrolase family protein [Streptomyces coeruleorubidus]|uniref:amidohydrolase family protein n=1 Tax=Streptomyces coeruleorubidus TaxID=116188 RepID=UPI0037012CAC